MQLIKGVQMNIQLLVESTYVQVRQYRKFLINYTGPDIYKKKTNHTVMRELTPEQKLYPPTQIVMLLPNVKIFCDQCQKNITLITSIRTEEHDYCVGCFSQLEEFPSYRVCNKLTNHITDTQWTSLQELLMLAALQKWGFGNWQEVKDFMDYNGGKFTLQQIENHYDQCYLQKEDMVEEKQSQMIEEKFQPEIRSEKNWSLKDQRMKKKNNVLGFNPKRGDFESEYDDKAECLIAELQFKDTDTPEQCEYKFKLIDEYNRRLTQREKRKKFTLDHHILDLEYLFNQEYAANRYEKDARLLMQPFTRFQSHFDHQKTVSLIAESNELKALIGGLKKCRRKIDKEGKIQSTLKYLQQNKKEKFKNENPRKIYHFDKVQGSESELIAQLQKEIAKQEQNENLSLTIFQKTE